MSSPLIERLFTELGYPEITADNHDEFVGGPDVSVLFFTGDPKKFRETNDVAVILPELAEAFQGRIRASVVSRSAEVELQMRYGFKTWPALVFVCKHGYLGTISGVQNWTDYLSRIEALLSNKPGRPPGFKIPVVADS
jgi:hydrogenase-1 operon protein HyaE